MKKISFKQKVAACVAAACVIAAVVAVPVASGQWAVKGDASESHPDSTGAKEVTVTVDDSANNGDVWTKLVFIPSDGTVADTLTEDVLASNDQNGLKAIHNYDFWTIKKKIEKGNYECRVYAAESQNPGCQMYHDTEGTLVTDYSSQYLERYDNVVFTLVKGKKK